MHLNPWAMFNTIVFSTRDQLATSHCTSFCALGRRMTGSKGFSWCTWTADKTELDGFDILLRTCLLAFIPFADDALRTWL